MARILLVEDNEMNRDMLERRLIRQGYDLIVATTGQAAIDLAQSDQPDLVLLDIGLPDLDGLTVISQIRALATGHGMPIIVVTAYALPGDRALCLAAGADDYTTKPIHFASLLTTIEHWLIPLATP